MKTRYKLTALFLLLAISANCVYAQKKLVILHTNDTHSRIEPLPSSNKKHAKMGGVVNRKAIIDSIRKVEKNVLLIDAGDFVQGTPYFNMFGGRVEAKALNLLGYEVGTLGNHEFDNGLDSMKMIIENLKYPIVNSNYDFKDTVLEGMFKPYQIVNKGGLKIGIIGAGVDPDQLIQKSKYEGMQFNPIIETVNKYAKQLKIKDKCDLIIALTHIGINTDIELAKSSEYIDVIIGGHSHTYMDKAELVKNLKGKDVLVQQVGDNGAFIGKVELIFEETLKK